MVSAGVVMGIITARTCLKAIRNSPLRSQRCQQFGPADHRDLLNSESKRHLKLIFDNLIMVELDIGCLQLTLGHADQQHTLTCWFNRNQHTISGVFNRQPLACAEVEEAELVDSRVEAFHSLLDPILVRTHVDRSRIPRPDTKLPRDHAAEVLPQVLISNNPVVLKREIRETDALDDLVFRRPRPWVDDRHLSRWCLPNNQVVDRDLTEVESIDRRAKANDVRACRIDRVDLACTRSIIDRTCAWIHGSGIGISGVRGSRIGCARIGRWVGINRRGNGSLACCVDHH